MYREMHMSVCLVILGLLIGGKFLLAWLIPGYP